MAPPFPLCCLTGLMSTDAAGTAAAFLTGLAAGGAVTAWSQVAPKYSGTPAKAPCQAGRQLSHRLLCSWCQQLLLLVSAWTVAHRPN